MSTIDELESRGSLQKCKEGESKREGGCTGWCVWVRERERERESAFCEIKMFTFGFEESKFVHENESVGRGGLVVLIV